VVSGKRVSTPRPDPALTDPGRPGLRPHRHTPDHLHGWVFLQHQVWVDYWGNEHEIELMAGDYVANVIGFCKAQPLSIALIVWAEVAYRVLMRRAGLGEPPRPETVDLLARLEEIRQSGQVSRDWLHELSLLRALDDRLDSFSRDAG
jgi:hypothetical protein